MIYSLKPKVFPTCVSLLKLFLNYLRLIVTGCITFLLAYLDPSQQDLIIESAR
jgi:hypothetical protein